MKLVSIVGTNSDRSTNRQLLHYIQSQFATLADIEVLEIKDLPAFNEPEEGVVPAAVAAFAAKIAAADGVIISTPEYDHSIPAALKSVIEWLSYTSRPLIDKPVMIVGASHGSLGSSRAQAHMRQILDAPEVKARVMPGMEFLLGRSLQAFDGEGRLLDNEKVAELTDHFEEFLRFIQLSQELVAGHPEGSRIKRAFSWEAAVSKGGTN